MGRGNGDKRGGAVLLLAAVGITALVLMAGNLFGFIDFGSSEIDRTQPPLLVKLSDLSEYRAATSNFELIVDIEKDVKFLPDLLAGQRDVLVAVGTVDAVVDFSQLKDENVSVSADRKTVVVRVPAPKLAQPRLDNASTRVVARQRGLLDRVGQVFSDQPVDDQKLYVRAEARLAEAAAASDLSRVAEKNTRAMLESLLRSLGFEDITIIFEAPPPRA